ncbi:hypothetical protein CRUP_005613, partial [Coryphaenoides rupestris]
MVKYPLVNLWTSTMLCEEGSFPPGLTPAMVKGSALVVLSGGCDVSQKAVVAQSLGAKALLIASNTTLITPRANESEYAKVHIPLALMRHRDWLDAQKAFNGNVMQGQMYAPQHSTLDPSIVLMLFIA